MVATEERVSRKANQGANVPVGAGVTAGAACPACRRGRLALQEQSGGMFLVCGVCDWASVLLWQGYALEGDVGQGPCPAGHKASWATQRRFGRVDLVCVFVNGGSICGEQRTQYTGKKPSAWAGKAAGGPVTKLRVMAVLSNNTEALTVSEVASAGGLSVGQVQGCLLRCVEGKWVEKSGETVEQARGSAYVYRLTARGRMWVSWALRHGLYESAKGEGQ